MQINPRRIIVEDFSDDDKQLVSKLALPLNAFMDSIVSLTNKNIGYDNLNQSKVIIDVVIDDNGLAKGLTQINTGLSSFSGSRIVNVQASTSPNVISSPYLDCTPLGNGIVKINKFHGLPSNKKLKITIEFIG